MSQKKPIDRMLKQFKKGEMTLEAFKTIMYDLESLDLNEVANNIYHLNLLIDNLKDIFGTQDFIQCVSCGEWADMNSEDLTNTHCNTCGQEAR